MKIAIISDSHDNLANLKKVASWTNHEKISLILHCGDVCNQDTLNQIRKIFDGEVKFVQGNMELHSENFPEVGEAKAGNKKIAFVHKPEPAQKLAESGDYDLVFYGHTHKPWEEKVPALRSLGEAKGNCRLVNPGNVAGTFYKATFAVYDSEIDKLELKILELLK